MCANQNFEVFPAPDRNRVALVFERDCGATTNFSTHVSILDGGITTNEPGNVLTMDDNQSEVPLKVGVKWGSSTKLEVSYPVGARVFKQEPTLGGVTVSYQRVP